MNAEEIAWAKLPDEIKRDAVARLKAIYHPTFFEEIATLAKEKGLGNWLPVGWHFMQGMDVRNALRSDHVARTILASPQPPCWWKPWIRNVRNYPDPIRDDQLPGLPEVYDGVDHGGNWDDYYIPILEAAAGLREIAPTTEP